MSMEINQLTQMTTWLDEEHRRDKAELIRLQQRAESQEGQLADQLHTIQDLEGRLAGLQAQFLKFSQLEAALRQLKDEVALMLQQFEERHQHEAREAERVRAIERDNTARAVNEIRRDLQRLPRLDEEMGLRKAEQQRVGETVLVIQQQVAGLAKETEDRMRRVPFLEDARQQDAKRIAQLQQESIEALKRTEQLNSRTQTIQDTTVRQERSLTELRELVAQLRGAQREFVDGQLLEMEAVKRQTAEWVATMTEQLKRIDDFGARMSQFAEAFQKDRQVVESVERFQERINRDQAQTSELQRLGEERQKRQLEQWQEENEKRWKKELLTWEHQWGEQAKRNKEAIDRFLAVDKTLSQHQVQIGALWKFLESQIALQTQDARRWQGDMTRLLEERPKHE
ncbi:MAG: hypothetical protein JXM73_06290 [Anaerolineae bacterium]|nr:hypothetical protein [Anaerolineae bacterium]